MPFFCNSSVDASSGSWCCFLVQPENGSINLSNYTQSKLVCHRLSSVINNIHKYSLSTCDHSLKPRAMKIHRFICTKACGKEEKLTFYPYLHVNHLLVHIHTCECIKMFLIYTCLYIYKHIYTHLCTDVPV